MTTETETITETPEQAQARELAETIQAKFDHQENCLQKQQETVDMLRWFFNRHHDAIAPFTWRAYGWDREIIFEQWNNDPKAIARAFGADGWRREHDRFACGSINWLKTVDGVTLKIENAESIKPKLIDEVKL